eukprot:gene17406-764_t
MVSKSTQAIDLGTTINYLFVAWEHNPRLITFFSDYRSEVPSNKKVINRLNHTKTMMTSPGALKKDATEESAHRTSHPNTHKSRRLKEEILT